MTLCKIESCIQVHRTTPPHLELPIYRFQFTLGLFLYPAHVGRADGGLLHGDDGDGGGGGEGGRVVRTSWS